jgi:phosphatidate cytidylyltransferase
MFKTRLLSSIVLVIIVASVLLAGGPVLFVFTLLVALKAFFELTRATKVRGDSQKINLLEIFGALGVLGYYGVRYFADTETYIMLTITLTVIAILFVYVFAFPKYHANQIMATIFSFIYAPIMMAYLYLTRNLTNGIYIVWLIFISSWICDTCAYLTGMAFGRHKLAPVLSPKKSVEGAVGGIAGAALVGLLYAFLLKNTSMSQSNLIWAFPVISAIGAIISQIGDLAASAIKRNFGIKDYGKLIPGHGGVMDRFDSVVFTAPMIYYLAVLLLK